MRTPPSPDDLQEMAQEHVNYEMTRMAQWATLATRDNLVNQALLESYLVHVRNMHEFLTKRADKAYPDAVVGEDYFVGSWQLGRVVLTDAQVADIHRRIAHLSTQRLRRNTPKGKPFNWAGNGPLDRWARKVQRGFGSFIGDLRAEDDERARWFDPTYAAVRRILG